MSTYSLRFYVRLLIFRITIGQCVSSFLICYEGVCSMTCGTRLLSMGELSCLDLDHVESRWIADSERMRPERTLLTGQPNIYTQPDCVSVIY